MGGVFPRSDAPRAKHRGDPGEDFGSAGPFRTRAGPGSASTKENAVLVGQTSPRTFYVPRYVDVHQSGSYKLQSHPIQSAGRRTSQ